MNEQRNIEEILEQAEQDFQTSRYDDALHGVRTARALIGERTDDLQTMVALARVHYLEGSVYSLHAQYIEAREEFDEALALSEEAHNDAMIAKTLSGMSGVYAYLGEFIHALEFATKALNVAENLGDETQTARLLSNIGNIYFYLDKSELALEYFYASMALTEKTDNKRALANCLTWIANVFEKADKSTEAVEFYRKAMYLHEEIDHKWGLVFAYGNVGISLAKLSEFHESLEYLNKALAVAEEIGMKGNMVYLLGNIGKLHTIENFEGFDEAKAEDFFHRAIALGEEIGVKKEVLNSYSELAQLYQKQDRWKEAYALMEKYYQEKQRIQSEEIQKQSEKFTYDRKIAIIQKEKEVMAHFTEELQTTNEKLRQINEEKDSILGMVSHDLKNPLNAIKMLANLLQTETELLDVGEIKEFAADIYSSSLLMFEIVMGLLDLHEIEQGTLAPLCIPTELTSIVRQSVQTLNNMAEAKKIGIKVRMPEKVWANTDSTRFYQIFQNLLSNAMKFSPQQKNIFVCVEKLG